MKPKPTKRVERVEWIVATSLKFVADGGGCIFSHESDARLWHNDPICRNFRLIRRTIIDEDVTPRKTK